MEQPEYYSDLAEKCRHYAASARYQYQKDRWNKLADGWQILSDEEATRLTQTNGATPTRSPVTD